MVQLLWPKKGYTIKTWVPIFHSDREGDLFLTHKGASPLLAHVCLTLFRLTVKKGKYLNRFLRFDRYLVLEAGADVDLLTKNGKTAAQLAREFGHGPMAKFLEGRSRGRASSSSSSSLGRGRRGRR